MQPASVGFQCPTCVAGAAEQARAARPAPASRFSRGAGRGAGLLGGSGRGGYATRPKLGAATGLAAVLGVVGLVDLFSGVGNLMVMSSQAVGAGQVWRVLTWALVSGNPLSLLLNILMVVLLGGAIQSLVGGPRMLAIYGVAALGGAGLISLLDAGAALGVFPALVGLLAANTVLKHRQGLEIKPDLILFGLLLVVNLALGFSPAGLLGLLGGGIAGAAGGAAIGYARGRDAERRQWTGLALVALVCAAMVGVRVLLG